MFEGLLLKSNILYPASYVFLTYDISPLKPCSVEREFTLPSNVKPFSSALYIAIRPSVRVLFLNLYSSAFLPADAIAAKSIPVLSALGAFDHEEYIAPLSP